MASVEQIHGYLVRANAIGNRARLRFAVVLLSVAEDRLYLELGHPNIAHYTEHAFKMGRTETHEALRVAKLIPERQALRQAFERGEITWSLLKSITRVATAETEGEWLKFAREHTSAEVNLEVRDAREKRRDHPRTDRFGLPNLTTHWGVNLTREERALLEAALEHAAGDIAASLGRDPAGRDPAGRDPAGRDPAGRGPAGRGPASRQPVDGEPANGERVDREPLGEEPPSVKDVLLYMAERFLHTDEAGAPEGRVERSDSPVALVFQHCEDCRKSRLITADGPVEVDPDSVDRRRGAAREERLDPESVDRRRGAAREERLEPEAGAKLVTAGTKVVTEGVEVVTDGEIDRPNPPRLARQVKLRDGDRCANPACGCRKKLHAHHIVFREHGGRTIAENEVTVCTTCHALIHAGLLKVTASPEPVDWATPWKKLRWEPRSSALPLNIGPDAKALDEVPTVTVESAYADTSVNHDMSGGDMSGDDMAIDLPAEQLDDLVGALRTLGMTRTRAIRRIQRAHEQLKSEGGDLTEDEILRRAIAA